MQFSPSLPRVLTIRLKLILAFGALIALLLAMAGVGAWRLAELNAAATQMATVSLRMERLVGDWLANTRANAVRATVLTYSDDAELQRLLGPELEATSKRITELQNAVERLLDDADARALFTQVQQKRNAYLAVRKRVLEMRKGGNPQGAAALMNAEMVPAVRVYVDSIKALSDHYTQEVTHDAAEAAASAASGRIVLATFCVVGVLAALVFLWLIMRSITRPIDEAVSTARRVADGDLTVRIRTGAQDEMGHLLQALADMTQRLRELVSHVAGGARQVAETCDQIAQGNLDLSERTEEQASTLEETASSMEELTTTVTQNADAARQVSALASEASAVARRGGQAVGQVVSTMTGISESSRRIGDIIGVIDGIAFQTNILALNAAVEAARAGDQGRGFAVVAAEVRTLAQRSAAAAKEIKTLINASVDQVEAGTQLVDAAGRTMDDIVASVKKVNDLIADIAAAGAEQSQGIEQVNIAISHMDQAVQQNASLAEEASAATESMKQQAANLLQEVARFRIGTEAAGPAPQKPSPRATPLPRTAPKTPLLRRARYG